MSYIINTYNKPRIIKNISNNRYRDLIEYTLNGKHHNPYGPAVIGYYPSGNLWFEHYYINDKMHNESGAALINYYDNGNIKLEEYYVDGLQHREDGPAEIWYYENGKVKYEYYYYINGVFQK